MTYKSHHKPKVALIHKVSDSFRNFADRMGYKDSPLKNDFISLLKERYAFLTKFENFSRNSKFWITNYKSLTERDEIIRAKLNREIIIRNKPVRIKNQSSQLNVSGLSNFMFCPVSFAIKNSFEVPEIDELEDAEVLRNENIVEDIIANIFNKRKMDFILDKLNESQEDDKKYTRSSFSYGDWKIEETEKEKNVIINFTVEPSPFRLSKTFTVSPKDIPTFRRTIISNKNEYESFISRGDYGDLLNSKVYYKGNQNKDNYYVNKKYNITGNPDYLFEKSNGDIFLVLSKLTWSSTVISHPFYNHIYQAIAYKHYFPELKIKYAYVFYIQSIKTVRLFKIEPSEAQINELENYYNKFKSFVDSKSVEFDTSTININKCFGCSARMLCSHKGGLRKKIQIPYEI